MKRILHLFSPRRIWLSVLLAVLSVVIYLSVNISGKDGYVTDGILPKTGVTTESIKDAAVSPEGLLGIDDTTASNSLVYCADPETGRIRYYLGYKALYQYCGTESRIHIVFGDDGAMFLHYVNWSDNGFVITSEGVLSISSDGKEIEKICGFDYTDDDEPPIRVSRLTAFSYKDGILSFAYVDPRKVELYALETETGTQTLLNTIEADPDGSYIGRVFALDGRYMYVKSDGSVYIASADEQPGEPVYKSDMPSDKPSDTNVILNAAEVGGQIYVTKDYDRNIVYLFEDGSFTPVITLDELYGELDGDLHEDYGLEITKLSTDGEDLVICTYSDVFVWSDGEYAQLTGEYKLPAVNAAVTILKFVSKCLMVLAGIMFIVCVVLTRKNLLVKQLMLTIPISIVTVAVILVFVQKKMTSIYLDNCYSEMSAFCALCSKNIDGDRITSEPADYTYTKNAIFNCTERSSTFWSGGYDVMLCVPSEEKAFVYADSANEAMPYSEVTDNYTYEEIVEGYYSDSSVCLYYYNGENGILSKLGFKPEAIKLQAVTPVLNSKGEFAAFIIVVNDSYSFVDDQRSLRWEMYELLIPCALLLAGAVTAVSFYISVMIKRATRTVTKIANGDFSARVDSRASDELGEICRSVNSMASSLDTMFREKDENEQFYYKFVPEKFRELLGKERFTDLNLGDAESRELTVLFTDIRSFSLNSEMMTAKENFEFVNVIYGKAGPIVRKHGGFVDKYIGDAVMALFESPDSAVACGIELYREIVLDHSTAETLGISDINIGIGIHTGMARIGIVGESERLSGTVISDTVNLSSRLESLTKQYHTAMLVSKDTLDRMTDPESLDLRYLGILQVAGVNEVKAVYEVLDCIDGEIRDLRSASKNDFREAVRLFHLGRRDDAAALLQKMIDEGRADDTVQLYLDYIKGMSADDKGNVFRFVRK